MEKKPEAYSEGIASEYARLKAQGQEALRENDYEQALKFFEQALMEAPNDPDAYKNVGRAYGELEMLEKAQEYYYRAIEIDPFYWKAYSNLANIFHDKKDYESAIDFAKKSLSINPDNTLAHNNLGIYYNDVGRFQEAEACYKESIRLDSAFLAAKYNYGIFLKQQKRWQEAIDLFEMVAEDPPQGAKLGVFRHLAEIYVHIRDENHSDEVCKNLIYYMGRLLDANEQNYYKESMSDEWYYYAHSQIAFSFWELKDYCRAIEKYEKCLEIDPLKKLDFIYYYLACSYYSTLRFDTAIEYCEKWIQLEDCEISTAYELMGNIYETQGDLETAKFYWEKGKEC